MIEVRNLRKIFQKKEVLKGISVILEEGKINLIIGQSGSGKTVFLKCILGLLKYSYGDILYDGINLKDMTSSHKKNLKLKFGTVFQSNALFDSMNIEENISFPLKMFTKESKNQIKNKVDKVLERLNLENIHDKYPQQISGGMKKRVAIGRAIINNPKFLFCDEPNSGLDPKTSTIIDNLIYQITREYNTTTIINTHDMNSVLEIGEKIIFLKNGLKIWEGTSVDILKTTDKEVTTFVYPSNFLKNIRNTFVKKNY